MLYVYMVPKNLPSPEFEQGNRQTIEVWRNSLPSLHGSGIIPPVMFWATCEATNKISNR